MFTGRGQASISTSLLTRSELVEELFAEVKAFIQRHWKSYEDNPDQGFDTFLEWCIDTVGRRKESAEGHFRNSGLTIEYIWFPTFVGWQLYNIETVQSSSIVTSQKFLSHKCQIPAINQPLFSNHTWQSHRIAGVVPLNQNSSCIDWQRSPSHAFAFRWMYCLHLTDCFPPER